MFKKYNPSIIISIVIILIISTISISGCNKWNLSPDAKVNKTNFSLVFRFGYGGGKNVLNTTYDTFEKDLVEGPPAITSLSLSEEDLKKIYQKMIEIDFFNYPDIFSATILPDTTTIDTVEPYEACLYYFKVEYNSRIKELLWVDDNPDEDEKANKLRELTELIEDIIYSKGEYKELPEPRSCYE